MILALALRLPGVLGFGLWLDEITLHGYAAQPWAAVFRNVHWAHVIPVKALLSLADREPLLRLPSLLFGVASIPLGFVVGARLGGRRVGVLFAWFLTAVPYFINYSIDAMYYAHLMFWGLLGLYLTLRLVETGRFRYWAPLAACAVLAFFVHPFSALYFVGLAVVALPAQVWSHAERLRAEGSARLRRAFLMGWVGLAAGMGVGILLFALLAPGPWDQLRGFAVDFAGMLSLGSSPEGAEPSLAFLTTYLSRVGPATFVTRNASPAEQGLALIGAYSIFALFLGGVALAWGRRPAWAGVLALPFLLSFGVIFNFQSGHFFHIRYFSPLVPLYWLGVALALDRLMEPVSSPWRVAVAVAPVVFALPQFGFLAAALVTGEGRNWDRVMPRVLAEVRHDAPFIYTTQPEDPIVPYYLAKYGLDPAQARRLRFTTDRPAFAQAELMDLCYRTPTLVYVASWHENHSPEALAWAASRLEPVAASINVLQPANDFTAYKWTLGGRYVLPPRILRIEPAHHAGHAASLYATGLVVEQTLPYEIRFYPHHLPTGEQPVVEIDNATLKLVPGRSGAGEDFLGGQVELTAGPHHLSWNLSGPPVMVHRIEVIPRFPEGLIRVDAALPFDVSPDVWTWTPLVEGRRVLAFKRDASARYALGLAEGGRYRLTCEGRDDPPEPIWMELRLDDRAVGVLEFGRRDGRWRGLGFDLEIEPGDHVLEARFLKSGTPGRRPPDDLEHDGWLREITLRPTVAPGPDERFFIPVGTPRPVPLDPPGAAELVEGWAYVAREDLRPTIQIDAETGQGVFSATIPRLADGLLLAAPPQPVGPARLGYFSARLRAENLINHSINMRARYLDAEGRPVGEAIVSGSGLTATTDWVRFVEFRPVPEGVAAVQPILWVYPNGRRPSPADGRLYFTGLQLEAP